jgi:hypothetical protein
MVSKDTVRYLVSPHTLRRFLVIATEMGVQTPAAAAMFELRAGLSSVTTYWVGEQGVT